MMKKDTRVLSAFDPAADVAAIAETGRVLREGGLAAIPTETVYGLAANALDAAAVSSIFTAKGRPQDNPLIVHVSSHKMLAPLVTAIPEAAQKLMDAFWPGPLTIILPRSQACAENVSGGLGTIGVRMPENAIARAVIEAAGVPLAAPSANLSGSPSPTTARHVLDDLQGRVDIILCSDDCRVGVESTVVSFDENGIPLVLRPGMVSAEAIAQAAGAVKVSDAVIRPLEKGEIAASPGMKYRHYAPHARVILLRGTAEQYADYVNSSHEEGVQALCFAEDAPLLNVPCESYGRADAPDEQAHCLFTALRTLDEHGARLIYAHCPESEGEALAVYNRLLRAASFEVISL